MYFRYKQSRANVYYYSSNVSAEVTILEIFLRNFLIEKITSKIFTDCSLDELQKFLNIFDMCSQIYDNGSDVKRCESAGIYSRRSFSLNNKAFSYLHFEPSCQ